jgi:hypothetical protein
MFPANSQQELRYSTKARAKQKPPTSVPPPASPGYQAAPYTHADQPFQANPHGQAPAYPPTSVPVLATIPTQIPTNPIEQRVLDLLYPYRDECFKDDDVTTVARERAALILCGTLQPLHFTVTY